MERQKLRVWAISDSHKRHSELNVPENIDMVIHSGDFTNERNSFINANEALDFFAWYEKLPIAYKVLIAGNHDTSLQTKMIKFQIPGNIVYLEHEMKEVGGVRIFGSPYTPTFGQGWAFNVKREKLFDYWQEIPKDTDILVTHGPPKGILDLTQYDSREGANGQAYFQCGCKSLFKRVMEVQPKYHIFGHIHPEENCPNAGQLKVQGCETTFMNAAVVNLRYNKENNGHIFEI